MGSSGSFSAKLTKVSRDTDEVKTLASVSGDIYYENDNEVSRTFIVTAEFIHGLRPGDKLILSADGDSGW